MFKNVAREDEQMARVASFVFTDEHYGSAISEEEFEKLNSMLNEYKEEMKQAKTIIKEMEDFNSLTWDKQLTVVANILVKLKADNKQVEIQKRK